MSDEVPLVAVSLDVDAEHAELAGLAVGEFSPAGFEEQELPDGGTRFSVYVPAGEERRFTAHIASTKVPVRTWPAIEVVPTGWADSWKQFHQPIVVGGLWVGPPWQVDDAPEGMKRVVIEPGQGFGTGAHPTTRLMLSLLPEQPRASVLDLGCGSGVLAIAAALLGFGPVTAVDNDTAAIRSTRENVERNGVPGVHVRLLDALQEQLPRTDIVLANVTLDPLVRIAPRMTAPRLVLSGLLRSQVDGCVAAYEQVGYALRERRDRDGWSAIVLDDVRPDAEPMRNRAVW